MKHILLLLVIIFVAYTSQATVVTVSAASFGFTTTTTTTAGSMTVSNASERGYAVFNLASAGVPALATITAVNVIFTYTISGSSSPTDRIYAYVGDISGLAPSALYSGAITSDVLYTATWGTSATTKTMSSTSDAVTFLQTNHTNTISLTWVESASSRVYTISNPQIKITYTCATPSAVSIAASSNPVCIGATVNFYGNATNGSTYSWAGPDGFTSTLQDPAAFTAALTSTGIYTFTATSTCGLSTSDTLLFTANYAPTAISGATSVCEVASVTLTESITGGKWRKNNSRVTFDTSTAGTNIVTGVTSGTTIITYSTGCGTDVTLTMTISNSPNALTGTTHECVSSSSTLSSTTGGGVWSSSNSTIATVSNAGVVTGVAQGLATISYTKLGCSALANDTVKTTPAAISGASAICVASTSAYTNTSLYGDWSSSDITKATINTSGTASGVATGSANISYTTGCGSAAVKGISVDVAPASITGSSTMCTGSGATITLTPDVAAGSWSSSNSAVATVNTSTGVVYGNSDGSANISYTLTNGCGTTALGHPVAVTLTGKWLGSSSTNWNDAANWPCNAIPDASVNVLIPSGTTFLPDFSGATFAVKNFTVASGVTITIASDGIIDVKGDLTNNGTISGAGYVNLSNGAVAQTMYGVGKISNLTLNSAAGASVNAGDTVKMTGALTLTNGALATNGGIRLMSSASEAGRIAPIASGSISGNVTAEQYFQGGRRAYRFFGHPFNSFINLTQITPKIDISGPGGATNGFTTTATNAPSAYWYHTALGNSSLPYDIGWKSFNNANAIADTDRIAQYEGIRLYVRGAKGEGLGFNAYTPSAATVSMYGQVNTGSLAITMHKGNTSDYNMISNPYPSPVNIGNVITAANGLGHIAGSAFYIWNPFLGVAGGFEPKPIGMSYVLAQNSSFQVRAAADGATLGFTESYKATTADESLLRNAAPQFVALHIYDAANHPWDATFISFNEKAGNNTDNKYDATKAMNPDLNFYSLASDNTKLSIDARPYSAGTIIPLGLTTTYAQQYTIKVEAMAVPSGARLFLHDNWNNTYTALEVGTAYTFAVTADAATQGENRFELTTEATVGIKAAEAMSASMVPNPASDVVNITYATATKAATTINIMNVAGANVISKDLGNIQNGKVAIAINTLPAGIYMVEIASGNEKKVMRLVKE